MYRMRKVSTFKETESWKTFEVTLTIRAPDIDMAKLLIENGFDATMAYEDKVTHLPDIIQIKEKEIKIENQDNPERPREGSTDIRYNLF